MTERANSVEAALADRLVNYSDALVAVSFLSVSGIGLAVADADTRCTVAHAASQIMVANFVNGVVFMALIVLLRRWELNLRAEDPPSEMASGYTRWLHMARLVILWSSVAMAILLAGQSQDEQCGAEFESTGNATASVSPVSCPLDDGSCG